MTNRTEAVPAETDPSAEPAPPATGSEGGLPTVSEAGGEWNDALVVRLVSACTGVGLGDKGAIRKARAGRRARGHGRGATRGGAYRGDGLLPESGGCATAILRYGARAYPKRIA